jgi:hypothetical protein
MFAEITSIQRVNTAGGAVPAQACDTDHAGEESRVPTESRTSQSHAARNAASRAPSGSISPNQTTLGRSIAPHARQRGGRVSSSHDIAGWPWSRHFTRRMLPCNSRTSRLPEA